MSDFFDKKDIKEDTTNFFDEEDQEGYEPSKLESGARGAGQGLTMGFLDEIMASMGTKGASPSQVVAEPEKAIETEKQMMKDYESNLVEERAKDKAAREANPAIYNTSEIVSGILPGLASGGGAAVANVGKGLAKEALEEGAKMTLKESVKNAGKLGAKYGAVSGAGYSEADDLQGLAADVAIGAGAGATLGAGLPVLGKGLKETAKLAGKGVKGVAKRLPSADTIADAFKYGKKGKAIDEDIIMGDIEEIGAKILDNIDADKTANNMQGVKKKLTELGYKVDTKEAVEEAILDIKKISEGSFLDVKNKDILPTLERLTGVSQQAAKMKNSSDKKLIKKLLENEGKKTEAIIKGEKKLAKEAIESGNSLETVSDIDVPFEQLEIPLETSQGSVAGTSGKFKTPEGEEYVKKVLRDTTEYQPVTKTMETPDGRPIIQTTDKGTGKVSAIVGDLEKKLDVDLENLTIEQAENLRSDINVLTNLANDKGSVKDPIIQRAKVLAGKIKQLTDKAIEEGGDTDLLTKRKRFSDIFSAEELLGVKDKLNPRADVDRALKVAELGERLTQQTGFKGGQKVNLATDLLGEKVIPKQMKEDIRLLKSLRSISKQSGTSEGLSISGVYKKVTGEGSNLLGRGINQANKIAKPVTGTIEAMNNMGKERLSALGNKLASSGNKGAEHFGKQLIDLAEKEGMARSQAMWALSQSPAFRKVLEKQIPELEAQVEADMEQMQSIELPTLNVPREDNEDFIEKGLNKILDLEAGYQNQQQDTGNFLNGMNIGTNRGITPQAYLDYYGSEPSVEDMKALTKEQATEIYNENYIKAPKFDQIADKQLQLNMIDFGINSGPQTAIKTLQELVGVDADGIMGEDTITAAMSYDGDLPSALNERRRQMLRGSSKYENYGKGWENRISSLEEFSEQNYKELEEDIDRVNQQQSSGDNIPVDQLESLLGKIDSLKISEEDKNELENDAVTMSSFSDGESLKQKIQMLKGSN